MNHDLHRSRELLERAGRSIPLATQTLSKAASQWLQGVAPSFLVRGRGAHVWDVDGNEWVDYPMALGPVLLGYAHDAVDEAIRRQLADGITFTLCHPLEVEVAERIIDMCPGVEAVRFGKTGSDALSAAVRVARAATGRDHVLVAGYHGWHDWYIGTTTRDLGVPKAVSALTTVVPFGDLAALDEALRATPVAAVVLEPAGAGTPPEGYLAGVVAACAQHGAISVFDEVITGFRLAPGGARQRYGVEPDLSCYGKALGNGMPISAVGGSWAVMRQMEEVFFSGTHGGEALSLAAARAVLDTIADGSVLAGIRSHGERLRDGIVALLDEHGAGAAVAVGGEPERSVVMARGPDPDVGRSWIQQCLLDEGCLFNGSMFICAAHTEPDFQQALAGFATAFAALGAKADVGALLRASPLQPVFRTP